MKQKHIYQYIQLNIYLLYLYPEQQLDTYLNTKWMNQIQQRFRIKSFSMLRAKLVENIVIFYFVLFLYLRVK